MLRKALCLPLTGLPLLLDSHNNGFLQLSILTKTAKKVQPSFCLWSSIYHLYLHFNHGEEGVFFLFRSKWGTTKQIDYACFLKYANYGWDTLLDPWSLIFPLNTHSTLLTVPPHHHPINQGEGGEKMTRDSLPTGAHQNPQGCAKSR